ncbi:hypothetical protein BCM35_04865 [Helicobacter winghamensis]|uniref:Uncharacterized protein n=1 Tax=Helicobacter winghamensis TaxID=157268 RepID=A0A2N3PHN7_9HELI|nr:hypothetical protein BCM32_04800 [Helicobacter winghamensis]PKT75676.1 hypothetical protein BCM35_04865 [Helicobacter winghamensis]PKT75885.1 hypothetical protein BCM34_04105 [Helicobacter winghamensis]PKT79974.1 hypothetical protein BCM31_08360 [Helicobacter winghamensis]PKT80057.1 hypothetical protein BCM33_04630 [Helicobacter winghamensis]
MKKKLLFTFDLPFFFIISPSQQDELRDKLKQLSLVILLGSVFHPLLLCLRTLSVSKFFENIFSSWCFPRFLFNPLKYPILLFVRKMPC